MDLLVFDVYECTYQSNSAVGFPQYPVLFLIVVWFSSKWLGNNTPYTTAIIKKTKHRDPKTAKGFMVEVMSTG